MHPSRPFGAGLGAARLRASGAGLMAVALRLERCARRATRTPKGSGAALASERPLRGDEGVDVLVDIGRAPGLAALGELDRPPGPMSRLRGLIGGELKPRRLRPPNDRRRPRAEPANSRPRSARSQASRPASSERSAAWRASAQAATARSTSGFSIAFNAARRSFGSAGKSILAIVSAIARSALLRPSGSGGSNPNASAMSSTSRESGATSIRRSIEGFALSSTGNRITLLPRVIVS